MTQRRQASLSAALTGAPVRIRSSSLSISFSYFATRERTSTNCSAISGTGASRDGTTGGLSTSCSMVRRCTRFCGPDTSSRRSGREPLAAGTSSTSIGKYTVPAAWGGGCLRIFAAKFNSKSPSPALAFFCPRRAEWCCDVARAAAIDGCSCRHHEHSRRCLRR